MSNPLTRTGLLAMLEPRIAEIRKRDPALTAEQAFREAALRMPPEWYAAFNGGAADDIVEIAKAEPPPLPVAIEKRAEALQKADPKLSRPMAIAAAARALPSDAYTPTVGPTAQ